MRKISPAVRSVAVLFGGNMASSVLGALGGLLVARYVGPEESGRFRAFTIPLTYLTMLHLGTFDGLWRQIPYYHGKERPDKVGALAGTAGAWNLGVSALTCLGFVGCALHSVVRRDAYGFFGWMSQALCCWAIFYGGYLGATYRTISQFSALARYQLIQAILGFGLVFVLPRLQFVGLCIRSVSPAVVFVWLLHRNRPLKVPYRLEAEAFKDVVRVGLPFSLWGSLYTSVWAATESALMLVLGGVTGLGLFAAAAVIRDAMSVLPQAVYQVLMPRVVEAFAREGSVRKASTKLLWPTAVLTVGMAVGVVIVSWLLGVIVPVAIPKYVDGLPLVRVCLWFAVIQAAALPLNVILANGRAWLYGRGVVIGLAAVPIAAYLLLPSLGGVLAVSVGSLIGRLVRTLVAYVEIALLVRREAESACPPCADEGGAVT